MEWFAFSSGSIIAFTMAVLCAFILKTLLSIKDKTKSTWLLAFNFMGITSYHLLDFLKGAILHLHYPEVNAIIFMPLGFIALVQFPYYFPEPAYHREAKVVLLLTSISSLSLVGLIIHENLVYYQLISSKNIPYDLILVTLMLIDFFWVVIVLLRQMVRLNERKDCPLSSICLNPQGKKAHSARDFAFVTSLLVPVTGLMLLGETILKNDFSKEVIPFVHVGLTVFYFTFVKAYLNNSSEPMPIPQKLKLSALTIILAVLQMAWTIVTPGYDQEFSLKQQIELGTLQQALTETKLDEKKIPPGVAAIISRPLQLTPTPNITTIYTKVWPQDNSLITDEFEATQLTYMKNDLLKRANIQQKEHPELSWAEALRQVQDLKAKELAKVVTNYSKDTIDLKSGNFLTYGLYIGSQKYIILYKYEFYRNFVHTRVKPLYLVTLIAIFVIIFVMPIFLSSIVRPLNTLLGAVKQVDKGDLEISVPVEASDEIGNLTNSFNRMVQSIKKAKDEEEKLFELQKNEEIRALELNRRIEELSFARKVQLSLLPTSNITTTSIEIVGKMITASEVGGDYYDFIEIDKDKYCLAIGDATGHGVAAGLVVGMVKMALNSSIQSFAKTALPTYDSLNIVNSLSTKGLMSDLNLSLKTSLAYRGIGMCLCIAIFDAQRHVVDICSTGMPSVLLYKSNSPNSLASLDMPGPPLGFMKQIKLRGHSLAVDPGDYLIFLSDGFHERMNDQGEIWGYDTLSTALLDICQKSASATEIIDGLVTACDQFAAGCPNNDDMTAVVLKVK